MSSATRNDNNEALRTACILGKYENVKALLRRGNVDVNFQDHDGSTPLYHAATQDHSKITRKLLAHGADPYVANHRGLTPMQGGISKKIQAVFNHHLSPKSAGFLASLFSSSASSKQTSSRPPSSVGGMSPPSAREPTSTPVTTTTATSAVTATSVASLPTNSGARQSVRGSVSTTTTATATTATTTAPVAATAAASLARPSGSNSPSHGSSQHRLSVTTASATQSTQASHASQPSPATTPRGASSSAKTPPHRPSSFNTGSAVPQGLASNNELLWAAAHANDLVMLRGLLLKTDADVNWANEKGETALLQASYKGHVDCVRLLIAKGADLDVQDKDNWTALHWAAHKGHAEVVELLIANGADLTLRKKNGTAYDCACSDAIRALFPPPSVQPSTSADTAVNPTGKATSAAATTAATTTNVAPSSPSGSTNGTTKTKATAAATTMNSTNTAAAAVVGATTSTTATTTTTTGTPSSSRQSTTTATAAVAVKVTAEAIPPGRKLWLSVDTCDTEAVEELLKEPDLDVNYRNEKQETPLIQASYRGNIIIARLLLENGADPNAQDKDGWTALHWAVFKDHTDVAAALLEHGADISIKRTVRSSSGRGALAAEMAKSDSMKALFAATATDAAPTALDGEAAAQLPPASEGGGETASPADAAPEPLIDPEMPLGDQLNAAVVSGNTEQVKSLLEAEGIDVDYRFEGSETALIAACYEGRTAVAQLLVDAGADLDLQDADGWTALHWAAYKANAALVTLLLYRGADHTIESRKGATAAAVCRVPAVRDLIGAFIARQEQAEKQEKRQSPRLQPDAQEQPEMDNENDRLEGQQELQGELGQRDRDRGPPVIAGGRGGSAAGGEGEEDTDDDTVATTASGMDGARTGGEEGAPANPAADADTAVDEVGGADAEGVGPMGPETSREVDSGSSTSTSAFVSAKADMYPADDNGVGDSVYCGAGVAEQDAQDCNAVPVQGPAVN